jgi:hypothetical protein
VSAAKADTAKLFLVLGQAAAHVDQLRVRLPKDCDPFVEFMMRRSILRARHAISQRNPTEALRVLKALARFADGERE